MTRPGSSMNPVTASIAASLSGLMYAFRYGMKEQYFKYLDKLRDSMDDVLYRFYEALGKESTWKER